MAALTFVDTNVLAYAYDADSGEKGERAREVLADIDGAVVSTQVVLEFFAVLTRKLGITRDAAEEATASLMELEVVAQRSGPVQDHQIRLQLDGEAVGENRAGRGGPCYGGPNDLWGTQITFQEINRMSVLTQYLCGTEPRGRIVVADVILKLHYRPWPLVQPGPM